MKFKFLEKIKISQLPKTSGVYCFKSREILYIGKATNIRERVKNHFQQPTYRDGLFLDKAKKVGFIETNSEIEALILEAELIKKYQPKYNVIWRDDKNYFYVGISRENYPRVFITHQPAQKLKMKNEKLKIDYVGPFVDGKAFKQTLKILRKVFPFRTCKTLPTREAGTRPCLWEQLGRCPAPCLSKTKNYGNQASIILKVKVKKECQKNVKNLLKILKGKRIQVLKNLKKEMKGASFSQDFEKAAKIRDQISSLEKTLANAKIFEEIKESKTGLNFWKRTEKELKNLLKTKKEISRIEAYDISNIQGKLATGSMVVFNNGQPDKNFYRRFKIKYANSARSAKASRNANEQMRIGKPNDIAMIKEVLTRRFKHLEWHYPDLILVDGGKAQLNAAQQCLTPGVKHIKHMGKKIIVISLAKKKNELFVENQKKPVLLKKLPREIFNLILQLRDEAHRFAVTYHKKLREVALRPSLW